MNAKTLIQLSIGFVVLSVIMFLVINNINSSNDTSVELVINIKNHKFEPDIITAPSGKKIRLVIHNKDNTVEEFESYDLHREKLIMPNDSITIILAPLLPGKYDFFGDFHQETAQGSLIVN